MVRYRIKVQDVDGSPIGEFDTFRNLEIGKRLSNYGTASFDIPINDDKLDSLVALRRFTVWIYREEDGESILVWSGEQALRSGQLDNNGAGWATIHCFDWLEQLNSRFTSAEASYVATDAGQIAWDLIDTTQSQTNGDLGIVEGTIEVTADRDRTYYNQNIMEAIMNLSNVISGFDFEITNDRVFNVQNIIGIDRTDSVILEYGVNVSTVQITEDFIKPVNRAIVLGQAEDASSLSRIERNDTDLQVLYKVRESVLSEMDVSESTTFEEKGDAMIQKYGTRLFKLDMNLVKSSSPSITDFGLGDLVRIRVQSGIYNIDVEYRVFEWTVSYKDDNSEMLSLVLGNFTI